MSDVEEAKQQVADCENEINEIKSKLRGLGTESGEAPNELKVALLKTEGLPPSAQPILNLQLSSPIEEAKITETFDPLKDESTEGMVVSFKGVGIDTATLSVTASDSDIPLGSAAAIDLGSYCTMEDELKDSIVSEVEVDIKADEASMQICTMVLRLTFLPSAKDKRDALYDRLNKVSQKKASAVQTLRKAALEASRSQVSKPKSGGSPAVKAGFLNKKAQKTKLQELYEKYWEPIRKIAPIAKNYVLFFGGIILMHFKGQGLALPPPV